ncbi:Wzz/FepE/Etk N-terminal domain-containing protein [Nesterenkonia xinjiangensis]|uniref:Capsular polysaccharide biosynthesis protein n=1 Tax=Nesterenkonia xinjiangensis TaxID=225327 RepID=A0A7Z0GNL6_9MICC|nr:Wzz/FepE/Etk N-terminal domain-containing protein [Nesterenkonia xinjiangensis]NYJ78406.1 capsular polysaccharide biosynthesis protein [Nesterenkonia xinjiangensis]
MSIASTSPAYADPHHGSRDEIFALGGRHAPGTGESPDPTIRHARQEESQMTVWDMLRVVRRYWRSACALFILGLLVGVTFFVLAPREYTSTARIYVTTATGDDLSQLQLGRSVSEQIVASYADLVGTAVVLEPVMQQVGAEEPLADFADSVDASVVEGTTLLEVSVRASTPEVSAARTEALTDSLVEFIGDLEEMQGAPQDLISVSIMQPAVIPEVPTSPQPLMVFGGALGGGAALGLGVAALRESLNRRVRDRHDVQVASSLPVLEMDLGADDGDTLTPAVRRILAPMQALRARSGGRGADGPAPVTLVASVDPEVLSAEVAERLARSAAEDGFRVLLIEASGGNAWAGSGFSRAAEVAVNGRAPMSQGRRRNAAAGIDVMSLDHPIGTLEDDLLHTRETLDRARAACDLVILSAAPVTADARGLGLAGDADATWLVVRAGHTLMDDLSGALDLLEGLTRSLAGTIVVGSRPPSSRAARRLGRRARSRRRRT